MTSLRSYRDLAALDANRRGLEHVIRASGAIFQISELIQFIQGVLEQLIALLYLDTDSIFVNCDRCDSLALENHGEHLRVLAATGRYADLVGKEGESSLPEGVAAAIHEALASKAAVVREGVYVGYFQPDTGREDVIYITGTRKLSEDDLNLVQLFLHNVSIAYENALLRDEIEGTQRDMVYMRAFPLGMSAHDPACSPCPLVSASPRPFSSTIPPRSPARILSPAAL